MTPRPPWLRVKLPGDGRYYEVRERLDRLGVRTVCTHARCPNAAECWGGGTATMMILGETCTRSCRFCAVSSGRPTPPDEEEPARVAEAAAALGLRYVVLTSVDRDDLSDGGADHFCRTVAAVRARIAGAIVEVLTPDFAADPSALERLARSGAQVLGHNLETPRRLTPRVRDPRCDYDRSLAVLARYRQLAPRLVVKSSLLLGLGETAADVQEALRDLRTVGVDWVTLGQYLRPTRSHLPVERYVSPEEFDELARESRALGFALVTSGPLVRSSYRAAEENVAGLLGHR